MKPSNRYKRNIKLKSDDGGALAFVIIMMMVLSIFVASVLFLLMTLPGKKTEVQIFNCLNTFDCNEQRNLLFYTSEYLPGSC